MGLGGLLPPGLKFDSSCQQKTLSHEPQGAKHHVKTVFEPQGLISLVREG